MKKFLILFVAIFLFTFVVIRDLIVVIDTIQRNNQSSSHISEYYLNNVPDDVVDLNDIFSSGDNDPTDYNYTELEESEWQYLDSLGVYWDEDLGYWRKRK